MHSVRRYATLAWALLPCASFALDGVPMRGSLTLSKAMESALLNSPILAAARLEAEARDGDRLQARLPDNPQLGVEFENFGSTGALDEEKRELTTRVSQTVDAGRIARGTVAKRESEQSKAELEMARTELRTRVRMHYVAMQAAQDRSGLSSELLALARRAHEAAREKVLAGKAPPTDSLQSFMAFSQARLDSGKAASGLVSARRAMAAACGMGDPDFESVDGRLELDKTLPPWDQVANRITEGPAWKRIGFDAKVKEAEVQSEELARLPPLTLEAGIRQEPEKHGRAFVAGLSLPLPAWNWNQGAIRAARSRKLKAEAEGKAERLDLMERFAALHGRAEVSRQEAAALRDQILPAAQATFEGAQEAYRVGKFSSLDALNAQRGLFDAKVQYLDALEAFHTAMAELEEATGAEFR